MLPESSNMNIMFGMTELVEEVARGEVASVTEAASEGSGNARLAVNIRFNIWRDLALAYRWFFMVTS
jgi:hypothetical protein